MSRIVESVEPDEVALENAAKKIFSDGKDTVDFATRERGVEEEADADVLLGVAQLFSNHLRE